MFDSFMSPGIHPDIQLLTFIQIENRNLVGRQASKQSRSKSTEPTENRDAHQLNCLSTVTVFRTVQSQSRRREIPLTQAYS